MSRKVIANFLFCNNFKEKMCEIVDFCKFL